MILTEKLRIFMRIYKKFDPICAPICYYSFIFGQLWISIGLSVFGFVANKYKRITIHSLLTICNIRSGIRWAITKEILNYSPLPKVGYSSSSNKRIFEMYAFMHMWINIGVFFIEYTKIVVSVWMLVHKRPQIHTYIHTHIQKYWCAYQQMYV